MGKNQSASNLTNIIKQDASGNITFVSGSTTLMSVSSSGAVTTTGNVAGTASYASNANLLDGLDSTVFTLTSSFAAQTASFTAFTSSVNSFSASIFSYTASQNILNGTYATTGSNIFKNPQTINSNLTVTGSITAATLVVQTITSSVIYSSGSNIFGNNIANTQSFTGSLLLTGSIGVGTTSPSSPLSLYAASTASDVNYIKIEMPSWGGSTNFKKNIIWHDSGNVVGGIGMSFTSPYTYMDFHSFYNSAHTTGSLMRIQGNGNIGMGTTSPAELLHLYKTTTVYQMIQTVSGGSGTVYRRSNSTTPDWTIGHGAASANENFEVYTAGTGAFTWTMNGAERMRITSAGRVGIGQASPGIALSVAGQSEAWQFGVTTVTGTAGALIGSPSANVLAFGNWSGTERMRIESDGKVIAPYGYQSFKGSITLTAGSTGTIHTMASDGVYYVYSRFYGASGIFMASAIVSSLITNGESFISNTRTGSNINITVSGSAIRVTNGGFGTYTFQWSILLQPVDF